jgi:Carboxypeptidase regulatory-like domain
MHLCRGPDRSHRSEARRVCFRGSGRQFSAARNFLTGTLGERYKLFGLVEKSFTLLLHRVVEEEQVANSKSLSTLQLLPLLILLLCGLPCFAQYSSNIQGVVSDPAGAAINGASIELHNVETGVTAVITTSDSGNYRFSSLPPGNYGQYAVPCVEVLWQGSPFVH